VKYSENCERRIEWKLWESRTLTRSLLPIWMATQCPVDVDRIVPDYNMFGHNRPFSSNENDEAAESSHQPLMPIDEGVTSGNHAWTLRDEILTIFWNDRRESMVSAEHSTRPEN
jgi:hypothetical protein